MKPQNEKSLFHFLCDTLDKISKDEIKAEQVHSICAVTKEMDKLLKGERERVKLAMKIDEHERNYGHRVKLRELASLGFQDSTQDPISGHANLEKCDYVNFKPTR